MTRNVPSQLREHIDSGCTTLTQLLLIEPVSPGFGPIGITLLDKDISYNDGSGEIVYHASIGMVPAALATSLDMDVDNTEIQSLIPEFDLPIDEADISAGVYDFAKATILLVNYEDLSMGHIVLGYGATGQMMIQNGLAFWTEFTALSKLLKQSIVEKDSLTCRAIFGSQPIGTGGGVIEQRFPCGKDAKALFTGPQTVTSVGLETTRTFTASGLGAPANTYVPGILVWLTGDNAGRTCESETQTAGGQIDLTFETMFPIQVGDTFKIRPDCTKWVEGNNGCRFHFGSEWVLHYRGEPYIPVADADQINMPGATVGSNLGGNTTQS